MKPSQARIPKLPRQEAIARYARALLLAHPDLVLKALRHKPATHPVSRKIFKPETLQAKSLQSILCSHTPPATR